MSSSRETSDSSTLPAQAVADEDLSVGRRSSAAAPLNAATIRRPRRARGASRVVGEDGNPLIDAHEDRWHWRRRIRQDPRKHFFYRIGVAVAGLLLVVLGFVSGPIPGPGGIPLVLLGLAIWSSEFEWAQRLMQRFKAQLRRFQSWSRAQQASFWVVFAVCCGLAAYVSMLAVGIPGWFPEVAQATLQRLPGLP